MKKLLYITMMAAALLATGCAGEEDDLFDASAAERLNAASAKYSALLESNTNGWVVQYYPTNDGNLTTGVGYLWCLKFNSDQTVNVGMNNYFSGNVYKEDTSGWEVITDNGPVLSFNTANKLIHAFSNPDVRNIPDNDDNVWGVGVGGDYEFVIVDAPEDHSYMMLKGKKRGTYNLMTPIPDSLSFKDYLDSVQTFRNAVFPTTSISPLILTLGTDSFMVSNMSTPIISMYPRGGDELTETEEHVFNVYRLGDDYYFRFRSAFDVEGDRVQQFKYDKEAQKFVSEEHENCAIVGTYPIEFFLDWMKAGHKWSIVSNSTTYNMSEQILSAYNDAAAALKKVNWTLLNAQLTVSDDDAILDILLRNSRKQNTTISYRYALSVHDSNFSIIYKEPIVTEKSQAAATLIEAVPELQTFLQTISNDYSVAPTGHPFVLNRLALTGSNGVSFETQFAR